MGDVRNDDRAVARRADPGLPPLPNFLIVGAMRSGTTWLARCLGEHPSVFMAPRKELHYFDVDPDQGLDHYRQWFAAASDEIAIGEATQRYMYAPRAVDRIAEVLPDARLIAILRDPVDRAYSHYWLNRAHDREPLSFEEALDAEPERIERDARSRFLYSYVDRGRYAEQLAYVLERFPRHSLHVLLFEAFRDHPSEAYADLCRFLTIDDRFRPGVLDRKVNAYQEFHSLKARRFVTRMGRSGSMARTARGVVGRLNRRRRSYPPMPPAIRERLRADFRDDVAALEARFSLDLMTWNDDANTQEDRWT
jgi:Sulfotransferase domain